ncbi:MAG: ABC transporter ATP-binding protein [Desulfobacterota bacterium]|jgi:NitT/TauT family transport system ATP-binding protein|nr:ABC transporter ATP-binding protein [Thermodesulfobacteriota bacterium]
MALELIHIHKEYASKTGEGPTIALEDIHYRVEAGQFVTFIGPSGCGKTTLLRIVAGLEKVSSGRVILRGEEITGQAGRVGLVFQEYALFPWRTTLENIDMGLEIRGVPKAERRSAALEYIRQFGLSGFEAHYPRQLSGGMQQRVAIARTLVLNPRVVLMDEPFASLDSQTRNALQEFLAGIGQQRNETILFVTHNVDEAVFLSDRIVVLSNRPARIVRDFEVNLPKPRDRTSAECNELRREILKVLGEQKISLAPMASGSLAPIGGEGRGEGAEGS